MTTVDLDQLRAVYVERLIEAWPERDIAVGDIEGGVRIAVEATTEGSTLLIQLLGVSTEYEFDGSHAEALAIVEEHATGMADDLEGDRWTAGEGWREWRS